MCQTMDRIGVATRQEEEAYDFSIYIVSIIIISSSSSSSSSNSTKRPDGETIKLLGHNRVT